MHPYLDFAPVALSYVAALRGIRPRKPGDGFAYAEIQPADMNRLICLAASNPEGRFIGLMKSPADKDEGIRLAALRAITNVTFVSGSIEECFSLAKEGRSPFPPLNYLCVDERQTPFSAVEREALFNLAEKVMVAGGLLAYGYRAYAEEDGALRILVQSLTPEMDAEQAKVFLQELKKLGGLYFQDHSDAEASLNRSIASGVPDQFFSNFEGRTIRSGSLDTLLSLYPKGFAYAGDVEIGMNYVENAAPKPSHQILIESRANPFYEVLKDFAVNRTQRSDIWCKQPAEKSSSPAELFGNFVYGITLARDEVPSELKSQTGTIDLKTPLYSRLIEALTLIPLSIGDFLSLPEGKKFAPGEVVEALQMLIGCGIAKPMRGRYKSITESSIAQPRLAGSFNQYLDKITVTDGKVWLASPMMGGPVTVSAKEALVMQALNRAGLANSVSALLPELERLGKDPAHPSSITANPPTTELAQSMVKDSVSESIVQWYAYGLLAAA